MGSFVSELFDEIKSDLKQEIRTETKGLTKDAIREVKNSFKGDNQAQQTQASAPVQNNGVQDVNNQVVNTVQQPINSSQINNQPQTVDAQPIQSNEQQSTVNNIQQSVDVAHDDKVFGKSIDEYREIFQSLNKKHRGNIVEIYNDPDYQKLDAETKEYINRVYIPTIEQSVEVGKEATNEFADNMKEDIQKVENLQNEVNKDGVVTNEEEQQMTTQGMEVAANMMGVAGDMAPKYMDKAGTIISDLASRVENKNISATMDEIGNNLKDAQNQIEIREKMQELQGAQESAPKIINAMNGTSESINSGIAQFNENKEQMQQNFETAANSVGMTGEDVRNSFAEGTQMSTEEASNEAKEKSAALNEAAKTGSEEEIVQASKESLESTIKMFGSLFGGHE